MASRCQAELPSASACFEDDFEACIAHLRMPITHRRAIRTTNLLERLFVEERRRLKIIPNAFGEKAVLELMFGAMIRAAERWRAIRVSELERWRAIRVSELERRQMPAAREEARPRIRGPERPRCEDLSAHTPRRNIQHLSDLTKRDDM